MPTRLSLFVAANKHTFFISFLERCRVCGDGKDCSVRFSQVTGVREQPKSSIQSFGSSLGQALRSGIQSGSSGSGYTALTRCKLVQSVHVLCLDSPRSFSFWKCENGIDDNFMHRKRDETSAFLPFRLKETESMWKEKTISYILTLLNSKKGR